MLDAINRGAPRFADGGPVSLPAMPAMLAAPQPARGGEGVTIAPVYNVTVGPGSAVTAGELRAVLDQHTKQLKGALPGMIADARSRGALR